MRLSEARGAIGARACGQGPCGAASQEPRRGSHDGLRPSASPVRWREPATAVPVAPRQSTRKPGIAVKCILRLHASGSLLLALCADRRVTAGWSETQ